MQKMWRSNTCIKQNQHQKNQGQINEAVEIDKNKLGYTSLYTSQNYIALGSGDSKLGVYKEQNDGIKKIVSMIPHANPICCLCIFDNFIFTSETKEDPLIKIWNIIDSSLIRTLKGHSKKITRITCRNLNLFASASEDKTAKVWRHSQKQQQDITTLEHQLPVLAVKFLHQQLLLTGGDDCLMNIWNWKINQKLKTVISHTNSLNFICIKGDLVVTGGGDGMLRLWTIDSLSKRKDFLIVMTEKEIKISDHQTTFCCKVGNKFYLCDSENKLFILDEDNDIKQLNIEIPYEQRIKGIGFHKNNLITITDVGKLTSWRIPK